MSGRVPTLPSAPQRDGNPNARRSVSGADGAAAPPPSSAELASSCSTDAAATLAAERAAREAYGRLLATLARRTRDIAAAEDALGEAFAKALASWPHVGVPERPEAWLTVTALNAAHDAHRRSARHGELAPTLALLEQERAEPPSHDPRLGLILAASHPAIAVEVHAPLILQTVFGVGAAEMAPAFLVSPAALAQRLTRAKAKIKATAIPFDVDPPDRKARLTRALDAVYALYTLAKAAPRSPLADDRARDALHLSELFVSLAADEPEALGLAALVRFCEARRGAERNAESRYVPLSQQDVARWDRSGIAAAEALLARAATAHAPGPYQLEAAIQSVHCDRLRTGRTEWGAVAALHDALFALSPCVGGAIARAVAHAKAHGPSAGLALLDALPHSTVATYQPYWAARANLLARSGACGASAFDTAIRLAQDEAVREHLRGLRNDG